AYSRPRQKGIIAININDDDQLIDAMVTDDDCNVVMATKYGQAIRFETKRVRAVGRNSMGVRGIRLSDQLDDEVIGMISVKNDGDAIASIAKIEEVEEDELIELAEGLEPGIEGVISEGESAEPENDDEAEEEQE